MNKFGSKAIYALLYAGNQALAVLTTILVIRYGKDTFGLTWSLGALLTLGWGATMFGLLAPSLSSRIWSTSLRTGIELSLRNLLRGALVVSLLCLMPLSADHLVALSGISKPWILIFGFIGLVRSYAQVMSTLSIRLARHHRVLSHQLVGRILEVGLATGGCLLGEPALLVLAWLIYPLSQTILFIGEWRQYRNLLVPEVTSDYRRLTGLTLVASQAFDLIMPTLWLRMGGETIFIAYRAITAALANSALLPRYWYIVATPSLTDRSGPTLIVVGVILTFLLSAVFQLGTGAVPINVILWSSIPLLINSLVMPTFSKMRQACLNQGELVPPAAAIIAGRLSEILLLLIFSSIKALPSGGVVIAYTGYAVSTPVLKYSVRRNK